MKNNLSGIKIPAQYVKALCAKEHQSEGLSRNKAGLQPADLAERVSSSTRGCAAATIEYDGLDDLQDKLSSRLQELAQ